MRKTKMVRCPHCGMGANRRKCTLCRGAGSTTDPYLGRQHCLPCGSSGYQLETCHYCNGSGTIRMR